MKKNACLLMFLFVIFMFTDCKKKDDNNEPPPPDPDEALMDTVQMQTFKYFWDFADTKSGMIKDRNTSFYVTTSGSGFGVMVILVGIERGYISREEGLDRLLKIVGFLETADRFHGVWPHWLNPNTGKVFPFSQYDNGGDLVETAFMIQGLLTVQAYFSQDTQKEKDLRSRIQTLWEEVEWDWYRRGGQNVLYWHWSPNYGWKMDMKVRGWNEALIVYVLAASSPTHGIPTEVYHQGWARNGAIQNGNTYEDIVLPLGPAYGGPLFFAHYSFLGLNPNGLSDQYANYQLQNKNHSLINYKYCIRNPGGFYGYSEKNWGLTASDDPNGYLAHSPTNDNGTISPTAALSSIVYTEVQSLNAMHYFYDDMKDKLWGEYGFYDAFNQQSNWYASSFLAIDQGPIVIMIENYRSGLLWKYFMMNDEVKQGLEKLGFAYQISN